ncbi:DUF423-domain-containing protein [Cenococcum geophilum]
MPLPFWTLGCIYARLNNWSTAAQYYISYMKFIFRARNNYFTPALLLTAVAAPQNVVAGSLFTAGMTMFSGSIYLLVLDPQRFKWLRPITPLGGLCLIGGWLR